jgi:hypothetical protein
MLVAAANFRIGLHAGPAIVGNFGGDRFFDYTGLWRYDQYGGTIVKSKQAAWYAHLP